MPERDENAILRETFDSIIDANDMAILHSDAGIAIFEQSARQAREYLVTKYIDEAAPLSESDVRRLSDELNEGWAHHGDTVTVTGRLYLIDDSFDDEIGEEFGEAEIDDESGESFYLAENVEVISQGIEIKEIYADRGLRALEDFQIVYMFSIKGKLNDTAILAAHPDQLFRHEYKDPTPEEAAARLEHKWPEQYRKINKFLQPKGRHNLPRRLDILTRSLQRDLSSSEEFRQLVQIYIDDAMGIENRLPYIITVQGEMSGFNGDDPDNPEDGDEWIDVFTEESMSIMAFYPSFRLVPNKDGLVEAHFLMATFNSEDGDEEEYIRVNVKNVRELRSTRAMRSIVSRAIEDGIDVLGWQVLSETDSEVQSEESIPDTTKDTAITYAKRSEHKSDLEIISEMKSLDAMLCDTVELVKKAYTKIYNSQEEAMMASMRLVTDDIIPRYRSLALSRQFMLKVSGPGVRVPLQQFNYNTDGDKHSVSFSIDAQNPLAPINPGDSLSGVFYAFVPTVEAIGAEDGSIAGYRASPSLLIATPSHTKTIHELSGTSVVDITVDKKLVIPLNGSAEIKLPELVGYAEAQQAIDIFTHRYRNVPLSKQMRLLLNILVKEEQPAGYVELKHVEYLSSIGNGIKELASEGKDVKALLEALESFFVGSVVRLQGMAYVKKETSLEEAKGEGADMLDVYNILDIRDDVFEGDIVFVIQNPQHGVMYVPLSSITKYMF